VYKFILIMLMFISSHYSVAQNVDPTKPLTSFTLNNTEEVKKGLVLETIIYRHKTKSAIISGKLMKVGDYINEHELIAVNTSDVILSSNGERLTLSMFSHVVAK